MESKGKGKFRIGPAGLSFLEGRLHATFPSLPRHPEVIKGSPIWMRGLMSIPKSTNLPLLSNFILFADPRDSLMIQRASFILRYWLRDGEEWLSIGLPASGQKEKRWVWAPAPKRGKGDRFSKGNSRFFLSIVPLALLLLTAGA